MKREEFELEVKKRVEKFTNDYELTLFRRNTINPIEKIMTFSLKLKLSVDEELFDELMSLRYLGEEVLDIQSEAIVENNTVKELVLIKVKHKIIG